MSAEQPPSLPLIASGKPPSWRQGLFDFPSEVGEPPLPQDRLPSRSEGEPPALQGEHQTWQTADAYLSGNVRAKLAAVLNAGPTYARNADTLREVQPEDVLPGDIDANLGAPWIPESDIQAFAADLFRVEPAAVQVGHLKQDALWSVAADYAAQQSVAATAEYGTSRAGGSWLLELALNMKTPVIYDTNSPAGGHRLPHRLPCLSLPE